MNKLIRLLPILLSSPFLLLGCNNKVEENIFNHNILPNKQLSLSDNVLLFPHVSTISNLEEYIAQVEIDGKWNDNPIEDDSVIISPYYNYGTGQNAVVYAALVTKAIHSFSYINYEGTDVSISIYAQSNITSVQLMTADDPIKNYNYASNCLNVTFDKVGTATFIINNDLNKALTFFVEEANTFNASDYPNKQIVEYEPGEYDKPFFTNANTVYHFKKGYYKIRRFVLNDNVDIVFDDGCYIEGINPVPNDTTIVYPDGNKKEESSVDAFGLLTYEAFFKVFYHGPVSEYVTVKNSNIKGRAIIDLGKLDWHARKAIYMCGAEYINVEDIMFANSAEWTYYSLLSRNCHYLDCKAMGYRTNSDGFILSDASYSSVKHCFARSGDDLFEVKSLEGFKDFESIGVVFDYNTAWPDKCRGMGVIHETVKKITSVSFSNSIICAAPATWSEEMGPIVVICGAGFGGYIYGGKVTDINFSNIRVYNNAQYPINISIQEEDGVVSRCSIVSVLFENITYENNHKIRISNQGELPTSVINDIRFVNVKCGNSSISHDNLKVSGKMIGGIVVNP